MWGSNEGKRRDTMKINPYQPLQQNLYRKQMEKSEQIYGFRTQSDKVEISPEALEMQKGTPFEKARQEKVAELQRKIEAGEYKINAQAVANKFYEFWNG